VNEKPIVADLGEKRIIREIIRPACQNQAVDVGVGDDAAIIAFPPNRRLVISTDKIPEDLLAIQLGIMDAFHHGRYLATVNISDIAAMGAEPLGLLCTLALPNTFEVGYLKEFINGFVAGGAEWNVPVVGGDTGWGSSVCVSATAFGCIESGNALLRSGAQVGDRIFVSDDIGGFGAALAYFVVAKSRGLQLSQDEEHWLRDKLIRPIARVDVGRALFFRAFVHRVWTSQTASASPCASLRKPPTPAYSSTSNWFRFTPSHQRLPACSGAASTKWYLDWASICSCWVL
jgi:thiamine-monophosphate kinase